MANTVIALKKSATSSAVPAALANGELAINYADGKLFYKHANGSIVQFSSGAAGGDSFGTVNANGTLVVADTPGDILTLIAGSNIQIVGDAINDTITISATGGTGDISPAYDQANTARDHANSAFDKANSTTYTSNVVISVADNTNAALRITQTGTGDAIRVEDSSNPDSTPFVIDATGNVGIGSAQAGGKFNVYDATSAVILLQGDNQTQTLIERASEDTSAAFNVLRKSRGSTASKSNVATGDIIGNLSYQAWGGSNWRAMGTILTGVENYVSDTNMSGYIALSTNDQTTGVSERMRIAASGNVLIGRTDSTVGNNVKLDVNGAINAASLLVNGSPLSSGISTGKAIAMAIVFG